MKTVPELVDNIANEAIYQLQCCKILYLTHKNMNKIFLVIFATKFICLITFHVLCYLKF